MADKRLAFTVFSGGAGCTTRSVNGVPKDFHYQSTVYTPYGGTGGHGYEVQQAVELTGDTCSEYMEGKDDG